MTIAGISDAEPTICSRDVVIVPDKKLSDVAQVGPLVAYFDIEYIERIWSQMLVVCLFVKL